MKNATKKVIIALVCYILFIHNIGGIALWDPDEPRQAIMAREMLERGDYIHPYLNGRPYLEKPPLYPWFIMATSKITGTLNEFSSRFPAALSATALVFATFLFGGMIAGSQAGFLSAIILATNYQFLSNARESVMDMTFALFIGLTIVLNYASILKNKKGLFILSFLPAVLAILAKGPAGLVVPVGVTFIVLLVRKEFRQYMGPMIAGCVLALVLSSIWFILAGEAHIKEFIMRQNITRYTNAFDHIESFGYYFHKLFVNFLPWSIILPFAIFHAFRERLWAPLVWFFVIFLFFEFSSSKRAIYLLPCYPACALLCGIYIKDKWSWLLENPATGILMRLFAGFLALLPLGMVIILFTVKSHVLVLEAFRGSSITVVAYTTVLFILGSAFFYAVFKRLRNWPLLIFCSYLVLGGIFYNSCYMPVMDRNIKSPRLITDNLGELVKKDIHTSGFMSAGVTFYIGKPVESFVRIDDVKDKRGDILLIVEAEGAGALKEEVEQFFRPAGHAWYENHQYTFYIRKDDP